MKPQTAPYGKAMKNYVSKGQYYSHPLDKVAFDIELPGYCCVKKYETANWSLRQGDEEVNKRIKNSVICLKPEMGAGPPGEGEL